MGHCFENPFWISHCITSSALIKLHAQLAEIPQVAKQRDGCLAVLFCKARASTGDDTRGGGKPPSHHPHREQSCRKKKAAAALSQICMEETASFDREVLEPPVSSTQGSNASLRWGGNKIAPLRWEEIRYACAIAFGGSALEKFSEAES